MVLADLRELKALYRSESFDAQPFSIAKGSGSSPGPNVYYRTESYQNPPRLFSSFPAAAEADNLKLHHIQFQIISIKRKICALTITAQMLPFVFLHTGGKLYFYSLPPCKENCKCPEGCNPFGSGFPIGASSTLLAHDFARQSLVCYTFCDR